MNNERIYSLDLLRGIAGYGVAVCHFFAFAKNIEIFEYYSFIFVEFFFVLSGFVLSQQLIKVVNDKKNLKIFYLRRFYRTIPLYIVALTFFSILTNSFSFDFLKYFFFIQKVIPDFLINDYFMVSWSLSIEEFFYFLFPVYLIFSKNKSILLPVIFFIIFLSLIKIIFADNFTSSFLRTGTFLRLDAIALGFLLSLFINKINSTRIFLVAFFLIGSLLIFYFKNILHSENTTYILTFIFSSELFSMILVLLFYKYNYLFSGNLIKMLCKSIGNQTYSVYLFHLIILYFVSNIQTIFINNFFVYLFLIVIFSSLVYKFFEKPILELRPNYKN